MTAEKFRPPPVLKAEDMGKADFTFAYFTNSYLALVAPKAPELVNSGVFICSNTGGSATYLLGGNVFQRKLARRESLPTYYQFQELGEGELRTWFLETNPNPKSNSCAIYFELVEGGERTLFQTATQVSLGS
jgi:hypothetical protein